MGAFCVCLFICLFWLNQQSDYLPISDGLFPGSSTFLPAQSKASRNTSLSKRSQKVIIGQSSFTHKWWKPTEGHNWRMLTGLQSVGWRDPSCQKLLEDIKRNLRTLSMQHHVTESPANLSFCTQPQTQFDHFPEIKLHRMPPTGCGSSSHLVVWHPIFLNHQAISSHTYGCTVVDTPELPQIPHFHWQMPCCEASSRASSITYSAMKVNLKSRSWMYPAFCVSYFMFACYVNLTYL